MTEKDLIEIIGCSRQRLHQLRKGFTASNGKWYEPKLAPGEDYAFTPFSGDLYYTYQGVAKVRDLVNTKKIN